MIGRLYTSSGVFKKQGKSLGIYKNPTKPSSVAFSSSP